MIQLWDFWSDERVNFVCANILKVKMSVALDNTVESQSAQMNLLLYQIYRPYLNGKNLSIFQWFFSYFCFYKSQVPEGQFYSAWKQENRAQSIFRPYARKMLRFSSARQLINFAFFRSGKINVDIVFYTFPPKSRSGSPEIAGTRRNNFNSP